MNVVKLSALYRNGILGKKMAKVVWAFNSNSYWPCKNFRDFEANSDYFLKLYSLVIYSHIMKLIVGFNLFIITT